MNFQPDNFGDTYIKNIEDGGSLDSGILSFTRPYVFSLSGTFSLINSNVFVHTFDKSIYPSTLNSATGFSAYASSSNSFSGHFYVSSMQLFNNRAISDFNGGFSTTTLTSAITSSFDNTNKFNSGYSGGDTTIVNTITSSISAFYLYSFDRSVYGDRIHDGSLSMFVGSLCVASDTKKLNGSGFYSLTSNVYSDTITGVTRFWVMPDTGSVVVWSNDTSIMRSLSAIDKIMFRNSLAVSNTTINLYVDPEEYNLSENYSFYIKDYTSGKLPDTWITTISLFNPWNDMLAVCKLQKPVRKGNIPLTFKIVLDHL